MDKREVPSCGLFIIFGFILAALLCGDRGNREEMYFLTAGCGFVELRYLSAEWLLFIAEENRSRKRKLLEMAY